MKPLKLTVPTVALAAIAALSASTSVLAQAQPIRIRRPVQTMQLHSTSGCASGWVPSSAPGGCEPGSYTTLDARPIEAGLPPGQCPEGFSPATPPLNPQLGCLPDNMATPSAPEFSPAPVQLRRLR
ncbi:MAG: hypothetical protein AB4050_14015 [Synechococcus sp.]